MIVFKQIKIILLLTIIINLCSGFVNAEEASGMKIADPIIKAPQVAVPNFTDLEPLHRLAKSMQSASFYSKILTYSGYFLGKPYDYELGDKLISWDQSRNQLSLISTASFDCLSYIEMVLALSTIKTVPYNNEAFVSELANHLSRIMFNSEDINYYTRNHFMETEWLAHNAAIIGNNSVSNFPYTKTKTSNINKAGLLNYQLNSYADKYIVKDQQTKFLNKYNEHIQNIKPVNSVISYISFVDFLKHERQITKQLEGKIYLYTMIMNNPKMLELTNSEYNIGHVGIVFIKNNKLYLRHATSIGSKVVEEQLLKDIAYAKKTSKIFPGFALFEIKPQPLY